MMLFNILANTKTCDFQVKDVSIPTKPTEKDEALPHQTNLPDHLQGLWEKSSGELKEEKRILLRFLYQNQDVFANSTEDLGGTSLAKHPLDVGCTKHIKQKPGRLVFHQREEAPQQLGEMFHTAVMDEVLP